MNPHATMSRVPSSSNRTAPLTASAMLTNNATEDNASLRPIVLSMTAKVEMQGM